MRYLGLVKWFNKEKGYGIIGTPEDGDIFLHQSNIGHRPPDKFKGTALIFETRKERGKTAAIEIINPSDFNDFSLILSYLPKSRSVFIEVLITGRSKRGNPYKRKENRSYDLVSTALLQLCKERPVLEVVSYFKKYFGITYSNTDKEDFLEFLRLFNYIVRKLNLDNEHEEVQELIHYFLKNVKHKTLFQVWKKNLHKVNSFELANRRDEEVLESSFEFPESIFVKNYSSIDSRDLQRISFLSNGSQLVVTLLSKKIEAIDSINRQEIKQLIQRLAYIKKEESKRSVIQRLLDKMLELIIGFNYSDKAKEEIESFHFVIDTTKCTLGEPFHEKIITEFNKNVNDEIIFLLWQKTRYFKPDVDFFQKNYARLSHDDFIVASEEFHHIYFQDRLNELDEIKQITTFGLLTCAIVETPIKVINETFKQLPLIYQVSIWLNFPRTKSYSYRTKHFEALYTSTDIQIDGHRVFDFFSGLESIDELFSSWSLVRSIQNKYSSKQGFDGAEGFRNLGLEERKELVNQLISGQDAKVSDFLAAVLNKIDESNALFLIKSLIPKFIDEDNITLDELILLFQEAEISKTTRRSLFNYISQSTTKGNRVRLWFHGYSMNIDFKEIVGEFSTFSKTEQPNLLRKTFALVHSREFSCDEDFLDQLLTLLPKENISLEVRICLKVIESLKTKHDYIADNIISEIISSYVDEDIDQVIEIRDFLEECRGRTWMTHGRNESGWYLKIEGKDFPVSNNLVQIGDNSYSFDNKNKSVVIGGKAYRFKWVKKEHNLFAKLYDRPIGVTFCDAVKSEYEENLKRRFYWCCNGKCYAPCQNDHIHLEWNKYSLRDFIKILNLPFEDDKYYRFVSVVNRANRLLKKLQCTSCKKLLRDARTSEFSFYRVTTFHCTNPTCEEYHNVVYLNHCLNWRCLNVVDSRISKKCPNEWHICDSCSNCCSQEKIERRYADLVTNNAFNPNNPRHRKLKHQVDNKLGHLERGETFNHKTGQEGKDQ